MSNELAEISNTNELVFNPKAMEAMTGLANMMANSKATIPAHLKGSVGDCFAIIMQSAQWRMNPFAVAQKTHIVNGILGYEAQLVNAVITNSNLVKGRFDYEFIGDWSKVQGKTREVESKTKTDDAGRPKKFRVPDWTFADEKGLGVIVRNTIAGEDKPRELTLYMTQAATRNSTLWADDPQQQLSYLAVKKWARRYCPDAIMGVYSPDELETLDTPREIVINPLPEEEEGLSFEAAMRRIETSETDDFSWIEPKLYTEEQKLALRKARSKRKQELLDAKVIYTQEKEPQNAQNAQNAQKSSKPGKPDWEQMIYDAQSLTKLEGIMSAMPAQELVNLKAVIEARQQDLAAEKDLFYPDGE